MIERYSTKDMNAVWSNRRKLQVWKEVETLVVEAWVEVGVAPADAAVAARNAPEVDEAAWLEREAVTHHDVAAFVDLLAESVGEGGEWIHFGLTSSDVLDTANGVLLKESGTLLLAAVSDLYDTVRSAPLNSVTRRWSDGRTVFGLSRPRSGSNWRIGHLSSNGTMNGSPMRSPVFRLGPYQGPSGPMPTHLRRSKRTSVHTLGLVSNLRAPR